MGDSASFRYGRTAASGGLEFAPARRQSRFAQYTNQYTQPQTRPAQQPVVPVQPVAMQQLPMYREAAVQQYVQPAQVQPAYAPQTAVYSQPQAIAQYQSQSSELDNFNQQEAPLLEMAKNDQEEVNLQGITLDEDDESHVKKFPVSNIVRPSLQDGVKKKSKLRVVFGVMGLLLAVGVLGVSTWFLLGNRPAITAGIRSKADFAVYDVALNGKFKVDRSTVEVGQNNNIVYAVKQQDNSAKFVVSQQAIPDVIKGDAQFQQFLAETDSYAVMDTSIGKAYFTKPANIGSDISVVVRTETTLMFIRGPGDTTEENWSSLLASLKM